MFRTLVRTSLLSLFLGIIFFWSAANQTFAANFAVNSLLDTTDAVPGDGICDDGAGHCTFRAAIQEAMAFAGGPHGISFSIAAPPGTPIVLGSTLPGITKTVNISAAGAPGASAPSGPGQGGANEAGITYVNTVNVQGGAFDILNFNGPGASGSTVAGINFFDYNRAIAINGANSMVVMRCRFGYNGTTPAGTNNSGLVIVEGSSNFIGGPGGEGSNMFARNALAALIVSIGSDNSIFENTFGTDNTMTAVYTGADRNQAEGILLQSGATMTNVHHNRIGNNVGVGIRSNGATGDSIQRNKLGIGFGFVNLANVTDGISLTASAASPVNYIGTNHDGTNDAAEGNIIGFSGGNGINVDEVTFDNATEISGNLVGIGPSNEILTNTLSGIRVSGAAVLVGGPLDVQRNIVTHNLNMGIFVVDGSSGSPGNPILIQNNWVGANTDGTCPIGLPSNGFHNIALGLLSGGPIRVSYTTIDNNVHVGGSGTGDASMSIYNFHSHITLTHNKGGILASGAKCANSVNTSFDFGDGDNNVDGGAPGMGNDEEAADYDSHAHTGVTDASVTTPLEISDNTYGEFFKNVQNNFSLRGATGVDIHDNFFYNTDGADVALYPEFPGVYPKHNRIEHNHHYGTHGKPAIDRTNTVGGPNDGPTVNDGLYPDPAQSNNDVPTPVSLDTTIGTISFQLTQLGDIGYVYKVDSLAPHFGGKELAYVGPFTADGLGKITFDGGTNGLVVGDKITVNLTTTVLGKQYSGEFSDPITVTGVVPPPPPPPPGGGGGRRAEFNNFGTVDGTGTVKVAYGLLQDLDLSDPSNDANTGRLQSLAFVNTNDAKSPLHVEISDPDLTPGRINSSQPLTNGLTSYLYDFFSNLGNSFMAMIWDQPKPLYVAEAFSGSGTKSSFTPPVAGTYTFSVSGDYSGIGNTPVTKTFKVVVNDTLKPAAPTPPTATPQASAPAGETCAYTYLDFPGAQIFAKYDPTITTVNMLCVLEPIIRGLISHEFLGAKLNLTRGHGIVATVRTYLDTLGLIRSFTPDKNYQTNIIDVDKGDLFYPLYTQYAQGYVFEQALNAAFEWNSLSSWDLNYVTNRFRQLIKSNENDDGNHYLFISSSIRKGDLIKFIGSTLEWHKFFKLPTQHLAVDPVFDSPDFQDMVAPLEALGIFQKLDQLNVPIPRQDVFPVFYRLQQLNRLLAEKFAYYGFTVDEQNAFFYQGQQLTKEKTRQMFLEKLYGEYKDIAGLRDALETRVHPAIQDFWDSWTAFMKRSDSPFAEIQKITDNDTDPIIILRKLKEFFSSFDKTPAPSSGTR